jgi:hypothetical protein
MNEPVNHSGEDVFVRLELLVGFLFEQLSPAQELIAGLKLRANASHTTRIQLEHLNQMNGAIWERLGMMLEEIERLKAMVSPRLHD